MLLVHGDVNCYLTLAIVNVLLLSRINEPLDYLNQLEGLELLC